MATNQSGYFLKLSSPPIVFEPFNNGTSVFYDKDNQQLFCVRGYGAMGVTVKGHRHEQAYSFRLEDKGGIQSIKFNPDLSVLAIKRSLTSVEFLNFPSIPLLPLTASRSPTSMTTATILTPDGNEYSQLVKTKSSQLHDFHWLSEKEIIFVTDQSIEHYLVAAEKRILRLLKTYPAQNSTWQLFSREMNLLLVSAGSSSGNSLIPFSFSKTAQQTIVKLPKFDVDLPLPGNQRSNSNASNSSTQSSSRRMNELTDRDCLLSTIYGKAYFMVIRQVFRVPGQGSIEVVLYQIEDDHKPAQKRHILRLNLNGKCALNVVDNLVLLHHQPSKATYIYDIEESSTGQTDGYQTVHQPLLSALSIQPVTINWQPLTSSITAPPSTIELYSSNWIVFLPNVIIDLLVGCLWHLSINLDYLLELIRDRLLLTDILLRRTNGKSSILALLRTLLTNIITPVQIDSVNVSEMNASVALECWIEIIARINRVFVENSSTRPLVDQMDIASVLNLFSTIISMSSNTTATVYDRSLSIVSSDTILDDPDHSKAVKFAISVILEYIRSLNDHNIPVQYVIYELLVNLLLKNNQFFQLQQLIQYQVLTDSLPLACQLLGFSNKQQPTTQLALDMLRRLNNTNEEIVEILLEHNFIIEALQYSIEHLIITRSLARKILEAAIKTDELSSTTTNQKILFFTVYTFFEEYFQRTSTIGALAQLASHESKDDLDMFKRLFNLYFRNQETDVSPTQ